MRELSLVEGCLVIMCGVTDGQRELVMVRVNDVKGFISVGEQEGSKGGDRAAQSCVSKTGFKQDRVWSLSPWQICA